MRGRRRFHMSQSVDGALKNWTAKEWRDAADVEEVSVDCLKERFRIAQRDSMIKPAAQDTR